MNVGADVTELEIKAMFDMKKKNNQTFFDLLLFLEYSTGGLGQYRSRKLN